LTFKTKIARIKKASNSHYYSIIAVRLKYTQCTSVRNLIALAEDLREIPPFFLVTRAALFLINYARNLYNWNIRVSLISQRINGSLLHIIITIIELTRKSVDRWIIII